MEPGSLGVDPPVEVVRGREAIRHRLRQVRRLARRELLVLDRPPYPVRPDGEPLHRGVRYRVIYDLETSIPDGPDGGQARKLAGVPMRLVIADRKVALVPPAAPGDAAVLLGPSALLDGLVAMFDTLWEHAYSPLRDPTDQQLLALLAAGLTDQAIARRLGVALRTVERRVRRMMDGLGARTRFQAGLRVGRGTPGTELP
jgi:hypothetical protein